MLLCSGKIYYDLAEKRAEAGQTDTALVRVERLYPLPARTSSRPSSRATRPPPSIAWVQEEPANMGAWPYMAMRCPASLGPRPVGASRSRPARRRPPARPTKHAAEHRGVIEAALAH